jgi:hypothetical protein
MIAIIEIQYQMKQGATAPYLCLADNNKKICYQTTASWL